MALNVSYTRSVWNVINAVFPPHDEWCKCLYVLSFSLMLWIRTLSVLSGEFDIGSQIFALGFRDILADAVDVVTGVCALSHYNTHITCPMSSTINDSHGEPCSIICTAEISSFLHFSFHHELVKFHTSAHYSECALFFL